MLEWLVRNFLHVLLSIFYRFTVVGEENVPRQGGALLICNHVSFIDGFLLSWASFGRPIEFMIWKPYYEHWTSRWFLRYLHLIPVETHGPRAIVESIRLGRKSLQDGNLVAIFPEGAITRIGNILPFKRGMEKILDGADVPVIPVHLDRLWGHFFSFRGGGFFKGTFRLRYPVTVTFGKPLRKGTSAQDARQVIVEMSASAAELRKIPGDTLPRRFLRMARRKWTHLALADTTGREVTYGRAATGAVLLSGAIQKRVPEPMVGLLLPASVGGALANYGASLAGKTAVNLNFTSGKEGMAHAMKECGIRSVITSRTFLSKAKLDAPEGAIYVEDLLKEFGAVAKLWAMVRAHFAPISTLAPQADPDSLATVVFSSGSTGIPKGVMLSHFNLTSNIDAMLEAYALADDDCIVGVLPFFHSFGLTVTLWLPVIQGCAAVYHPNPVEAKPIGDLIQKYKGTFLLATPTFSGTYVRKCTREQFASLRFTMVGAEKLREPQRAEFQQVFDKDLTEGYGCTEMSPVVAANVQGYFDDQEKQVGSKPGTVGLPLPGIAARIVDPETRERKSFGEEGLLLVRGPNQMLGYLNQPERTAEVVWDGWYCTGDLAAIDEDGFIRITDRLSRFSKIGGEMVPHLKIEDVIQEITGYPCAIAGIPDDRKGETLVALCTAPDLSADEVWRKLSATDLPNLWIPKREAIFFVEALPVLGTGKLDLRGVKALALSLTQS